MTTLDEITLTGEQEKLMVAMLHVKIIWMAAQASLREEGKC
jgi:hypothetical protein